jgi:TPR repeat protein
MQESDALNDGCLDGQVHHGHGHAHLVGRVRTHHAGHRHDEPMGPEEAVKSLLILGQVALSAGDYESAVEAYGGALEIEPTNETALCNLGSLYARGLGVGQDYVEAARLFHQVELSGNERARKLCGKCLFDYVDGNLDAKKPSDLYAEVAVFVSRVYSEATSPKQEVNNALYAIASTYLNRGSYAEAAKVLRASAEFGGDGFAQYYLGKLYNAGAGLDRSDLAALYWLDCAVDNGAADIARADRDALLDAYRQTLTDSEFCGMMASLVAWCEAGSPDVPTSPDKAERWRDLL